jgi:hypothetical protein
MANNFEKYFLNFYVHMYKIRILEGGEKKCEGAGREDDFSKQKA